MNQKIYQSIIYLTLAIAAIFSVFLISSDHQSPFTTQATYHKTVATIAPEVSGVITNVNVKNGDRVKKGDVLFSIDQDSYTLAVEKARAELNQAKELYSAKLQELQAKKEILKQRQNEWDNAQAKLVRNEQLIKQGLIAQQAYDDALMSSKVAEGAMGLAKANLLQVKAELFDGKTNAAIKLAKAKLKIAELDLTNTNITAETTGTVTNMQLQSGTFVKKGDPILFLANEGNTWISADFNEKGVGHLKTNNPVLIAYDALPGQLFNGSIISRDSAIYDASSKTNQLSNVTNNSRWIREQQKIRTRIKVDKTQPLLISGSKATVMAMGDSALSQSISKTWMTLVSYFRYIY